ncbi:MAG: XRE family transcriptional regulator [Rhodospirillaceae bacterium]|nr:MAG: XRE family transcriptional regulator [Rhodospirillaceae bacterium]
MKTPPSSQRHALAAFLRAQRARLSPASFGLPTGSRRRTPGLTREEAAQLGGMSATWYTWIEQGRDVSMSPAALARLARAFRLTRAERAYLFDLADKRDPDIHQAGEDGDLPEAAAAAIAAVAVPAYLLDRHWQARHWNAAAATLFIGWLDDSAVDPQRNLLRYIFLEPLARQMIVDWEERARRVVAEFRADHSHALDDPQLRGLIADLRRHSPAFSRLWEEQSVLGREGGDRQFQHPQRGLLLYRQIAFTLANQPDIKLVMLVPADAAPAP